MKEDIPYLYHIRDAIEKIESYIKQKKDFKELPIIQDAVIRQMEIIGEASKRISKQTKASNPDIPWKDMAGMRDKLIHGYFGVDVEAVWKTVENDIPSLKKQMSNLLRKTA